MRAVETLSLIALLLVGAGCITWMIVQVSTRPVPCHLCAGRGCLTCAGGQS